MATTTPKVNVQIRVLEGGYGTDCPISVDLTEAVVDGSFTDAAGLALIRETIDRLLTDAQERAHTAARTMQGNAHAAAERAEAARAVA